MIRKPVKMLWLGIGLCLLIGSAASLVMWFRPAASENGDVREFSALIDLLALALWMLLFAFYWVRHQDD